MINKKHSTLILNYHYNVLIKRMRKMQPHGAKGLGKAQSLPELERPDRSTKLMLRRSVTRNLPIKVSNSAINGLLLNKSAKQHHLISNLKLRQKLPAREKEKNKINLPQLKKGTVRVEDSQDHQKRMARGNKHCLISLLLEQDLTKRSNESLRDKMQNVQQMSSRSIPSKVCIGSFPYHNNLTLSSTRQPNYRSKFLNFIQNGNDRLWRKEQTMLKRLNEEQNLKFIINFDNKMSLSSQVIAVPYESSKKVAMNHKLGQLRLPQLLPTDDLSTCLK